MDHKENISHHSIVRVPCPHCSHLCSSITKSCPKCGEPLKSLKNTASVEKNIALIEEKESELGYIQRLELKLGKRIPQVKKLERNAIGYVKEPDKITGLSLPKCELTEIPQEVFHLSSLIKLYLRRNNIEEIPFSIDSLKKLEYLDVSINELKRVPNSIGFLSSLKFLNLSSNKLESLPDTLEALKSLEKLFVNNNRLREIPINVETLPQLKTMDTRGNLLLSVLSNFKKPNRFKKIVDKQKSIEDFL